MEEDIMNQNHPFKDILSEAGLEGVKPHPWKELFQRNSIKLCDVWGPQFSFSALSSSRRAEVTSPNMNSKRGVAQR